jgi:hypothetical protein
VTLPSAAPELARILVAISTAVFVGVWFLPPRVRQRVGWTVTVAYLLGVTAFLAWIAMR